MRPRLRITDRLFRFGGEEFVVLMSGSSAEGAMRLAEDLRARIASVQIGQLTGLSASAGVAATARPGVAGRRIVLFVPVAPAALTHTR
jgi:diguanylate cyclase (GGDEF)-like protein